MSNADSTLREQIASMFTEEGEHFENKLDSIEALIALKVQETRFELASNITTDKGDAYYKSTPIHHVAEQLKDSGGRA